MTDSGWLAVRGTPEHCGSRRSPTSATTSRSAIMGALSTRCPAMLPSTTCSSGAAQRHCLRPAPDWPYDPIAAAEAADPRNHACRSDRTVPRHTASPATGGCSAPPVAGACQTAPTAPSGRPLAPPCSPPHSKPPGWAAAPTTSATSPSPYGSTPEYAPPNPPAAPGTASPSCSRSTPTASTAKRHRQPTHRQRPRRRRHACLIRSVPAAGCSNAPSLLTHF